MVLTCPIGRGSHTSGPSSEVSAATTRTGSPASEAACTASSRVSIAPTASPASSCARTSPSSTVTRRAASGIVAFRSASLATRHHCSAESGAWRAVASVAAATDQCTVSSA